MRPIWPKLAAMNLNTVLIPVYWELLEPTEGKFDFSLIDGLVQDARKYNLRLVPLWFASWKNSMSSYAPSWVKTNQKRFPRSQERTGNGMEILSPFSRENVETDARAFAAFMRHLRETDGNDHTVIMIQVENEIGMIPDSRDRSAIANELFAQSVPSELMNYLQQHKRNSFRSFVQFGRQTVLRRVVRGKKFLGGDLVRTNFSWRGTLLDMQIELRTPAKLNTRYQCL
jgi:beta-galactosidase GanA